MQEKTILFLGKNIAYHTEVNKDCIPDVGDCVNIKNVPGKEEGQYQIIEKGEMEYCGKKYPTIFISRERIADFKSYLLTLDFSNALMLEY